VSHKLIFDFKAEINNLVLHLFKKMREQIEWIEKSKAVSGMKSKKEIEWEKFINSLSGSKDRET
jgi:hypothetical protein